MSGIESRLDELTALFRRRLLDDKDKRRLIDEAHERARLAEVGPFRQYMHPLVVGLALVVDRLDAYEGEDTAFVGSIRDELLEVLERQGVVAVATDGPIDPGRHEVKGGARAPTDGGPLFVSRVVRRGYHHGDWVFRPAKVLATTEVMRDDASSDGDAGSVVDGTV